MLHHISHISIYAIAVACMDMAELTRTIAAPWRTRTPGSAWPSPKASPWMTCPCGAPSLPRRQGAATTSAWRLGNARPSASFTAVFKGF